MCGIFGMLLGDGIEIQGTSVQEQMNTLFRLSESRGKEAAGCAIRSKDSISVYKQPVSASKMVASDSYKKFFNDAITSVEHRSSAKPFIAPLTLIGHSRLVTNGSQENHENNQPVIKSGAVGVHNGIIVNDEKLWKQFPQIKKNFDVDTEVLLNLIPLFREETRSMQSATRKAFQCVEGSASIAVMFQDFQHLLLATNTGSLYFWGGTDNKIFFFASELHILKIFIEKHGIEKRYGQSAITQVKSRHGMFVDMVDLQIQGFHLAEDHQDEPLKEKNGMKNLKIIDCTPRNGDFGISATIAAHKVDWSKHERMLLNSFDKVDKLKRCTRCILPETFPFVVFDDQGVCNYCHNHAKLVIKGTKALESFVDQHRRKHGDPDCIVGFSGGRDSSYALYYMKTILKMNPIAFSYDWGMLTDLGRRNQARMCGKLGIEHIVISADIRKKREYIRKNIDAWLKKPDLGIIPLFMAGDKQYFYYANVLMKRCRLRTLVMAENQLERVHFKHGFSGIKPKDIKDPSYFMGVLDKIKLASYYGRRFLANPSYINTSLIDTLLAYISHYVIPHDYLYLFNYIQWDEQKITDILIHEFDWELANDTKSTWRIGDGTTAFYNYIYYLVAGFSEIDAFRSNQIREGMITRERALRLAREENAPRFESIEWYAQTIGFDCEKAMSVIHAMPKLYEMENRI